ncbi:MAG: prepilin-type N-terminal cleavage/methylation domain-containing protein [Candidatus Marinimicrobia bacterium]|nr:prepilin-type N-terminal cleavage/methylation domain-containing protein [Candidatus Neomarinimicrobiota bacterium]
MRKENQKGFSLVELMIVLVIIGILAAVGVPIYTSNVQKAKMSEADAALGTIRTALRVYYAENGKYPTLTAGTQVAGSGSGKASIGIKENELSSGNKYFTADSLFTLVSDSATYTITCADAGILESARTLDQSGNFAGGVE